MLNKAIIMGRLGRDPEVRYTTNGDAVSNFSVATSKRWKDKASGEMKEETTWHRVSAWGRQAEIVGEHLRKGSLVYLEGEMVVRKYTDQSGAEKESREIRLQELKLIPTGQQQEGEHRAPAERQSPPQRQAPASRSPATGGGTGFDDMDDDIPFVSSFAGHDPLMANRKAQRSKGTR